jgi:hypothetical protein
MMGYNAALNYTERIVRASAVLTGSYVAGTVIELSAFGMAMNQLTLLVSFTIGLLTSAEIKVEFSPDGTTYYQDTIGILGTTLTTMYLNEKTLLGTGNYVIDLPIKHRYIKVSAKGTGTATNSLLDIKAIIGTV